MHTLSYSWRRFTASPQAGHCRGGVSGAARIDYTDAMRKSRLPTLKDIKADLAASEEDIVAGRIVPGQVVLDRIQAALDGRPYPKKRSG